MFERELDEPQYFLEPEKLNEHIDLEFQEQHYIKRRKTYENQLEMFMEFQDKKNIAKITNRLTALSRLLTYIRGQLSIHEKEYYEAMREFEFNNK